MFDIGIGELLALGAIGLLIFGPERLPKAAADAGRWARQIREMASSARKEITESAGVDMSETMDSFRELRDLHPKRLASGMFDDDDKPQQGNKGGKSHSGGSSGTTSAQSFDPDVS